MIGAGGTIDYVTPSGGKLLGRSPASLVGSSAFGLLHPDDAPDAIARFASVLRGDCAGRYELRVKGDAETIRKPLARAMRV